MQVFTAIFLSEGPWNDDPVEQYLDCDLAGSIENPGFPRNENPASPPLHLAENAAPVSVGNPIRAHQSAPLPPPV